MLLASMRSRDRVTETIRLRGQTPGRSHSTWLVGERTPKVRRNLTAPARREWGPFSSVTPHFEG